MGEFAASTLGVDGPTLTLKDSVSGLVARVRYAIYLFPGSFRLMFGTLID